ncbi:MAG: ATP-binding protein [Deltaproteobacteria bacterium]|nr:ATP-binding protein [Deltaproteobacteria bacterium]
MEKVGAWVLDPETESFRVYGQNEAHENLSFSEEDSFIIYLRNSKRAVELEHIKDYPFLHAEVRTMTERKFTLAVPLEWEEGMLGFLLVGEKQNGKNLLIREIEALEALAPAVAMAASRALLYQHLKQKDQQMMQAEKLAALGEMAASFVHEIRNPLGIILGSVETLEKKVSESVQAEMLQFIREESERINHMLTNFLDFAKPKAPAFREVDLKEIVRKTVELISLPVREHKVEILQEYPLEKTSIFADPEQVREALVNLEFNALEAMPLGGKMVISLIQNGSQGVVIRVSDTGVGLPKGAESKIFDPFFTTKERGTGLGLSIVYRVARNHGGTISAVSNQGGGTTFVLILPHPKGMLGCFGPIGPTQ